MFVDASAMVAILTREPEADELIGRLDDAGAAVTSPIAVFEAVLGISRKRHASVGEATQDLADFLAAAKISLVPTTEKDAATALDAFARYGKGKGHPAQLNLGDCFAYAVAKNHAVTLLFKGNDFDKTDINLV